MPACVVERICRAPLRRHPPTPSLVGEGAALHHISQLYTYQFIFCFLFIIFADAECCQSFRKVRAAS